LHMNIITEHWSAREFFRLPPDVYITDKQWIGPSLIGDPASLTGTPIYKRGVTTEATETTNSATAISGIPKLDGTWEEHLRRYYWTVANQGGYEWRYKKNSEDYIEISQIQRIHFRRVTSYPMGKAFQP